MKALLVDGYNLIYSHPRLAVTVKSDQDAAREGLIKELTPLASPGRFEVVMVVFDAAASSSPEPVVQERGGMTVVFTRRNQSADAFIEKAVRGLAAGNEVMVATSDRVLLALAGGFGAATVDGETLLAMSKEARQETRRDMDRLAGNRRAPLEERVSEEVRRLLDEMRYR